jgi:hypothetical protein
MDLNTAAILGLCIILWTIGTIIIILAKKTSPRLLNIVVWTAACSLAFFLAKGVEEVLAPIADPMEKITINELIKALTGQ